MDRGDAGGSQLLAWIGPQYGEDNRDSFPGFSGWWLDLKTRMTVLREYDHVLSAAILDELETLPGVRIHGITDRERLEERVPTVSFTWGDRHPRDIAAALGEQGVFVWDGNYYALAVTERLGLEGTGGMVRIGAVHYNTVEELRRLGDALRRMAVELSPSWLRTRCHAILLSTTVWRETRGSQWICGSSGRRPRRRPISASMD